MDAEPRHTAQTQKNTAVAVKAEGKSSHGGVFFFVFFSLFACFYFSCLNSFLPLSSSPPYSYFFALSLRVSGRFVTV